MAYTGYQITDASRQSLLEAFPPAYERVICHHITEAFGVPEDAPPPEQPRSVQVVGYIDSGDGVQGLLVKVNGSVDRPDGSKYHITLSLGEGKKPVDTNRYTGEAKKVIPMSIMVIPKTFAFQKKP